MGAARPVSTGEAKILRKQITVMDQYASRAEARQIASSNGGKLPSVKEFILEIKGGAHNGQLKNAWFWTSDEGLKTSRESRIDYREGTVVEVSAAEWESLPFEQKAYASNGTGPVAIYFYSDSRGDHPSALTIDSNRGALVAKVAYIGL